jgi:uncharacterized membrane protein YraQ (UPF0718 family)
VSPALIKELTALGKDFLWGVEHIWWYFIVGIALGALVRTYKIHVTLRKMLPRFGFWGIFVATGIGVMSPLCACGVIPIVVSLMMAGLPLAPAMALVTASPLMSVEGYTVTAGLLGYGWANAKLVAAVFMGIYAGLATHLLTKGWETGQGIFRRAVPEGDFHDHDYPDEDLRCDCPERFSNRIARKYPNKFVIFLAKAAELFVKVGVFTLIGVVIEVLASRYVPYEWVAYLFGKGNALVNIPLITLASIVLHVNQITAAGILFGPVDIMAREGVEISKGAGMAFLIGGPVTALPVMGVFLSLFKPKVLWLYLGLCVSGTLIVSYVYNLF